MAPLMSTFVVSPTLSILLPRLQRTVKVRAKDRGGADESRATTGTRSDSPPRSAHGTAARGGEARRARSDSLKTVS